MAKKKNNKHFVIADATNLVPAGSLENFSNVSLCGDDSDVDSNPTDSSDEVSILDKLSDTIELLTEKRPETRITAIQGLQKAFRVNYLMLDDTWNYYNTFISGLENSIKRGKPIEQAVAVECLAIFAAQISPVEVNELAGRFKHLLETLIADPMGACVPRGACALSAAWLLFLGNVDDFTVIKTLMNSLERVFKLSCLKGDGKPPVHAPSVINLHCACVNAWGLLYTALPTHDAETVGQAAIPIFSSMLHSTNIDIRLAVGDAISVVYERIRSEVNENFKGDHFNSLVDIISHMANSNNKSQSKNDLKKQRQTFRDLLAFLMTHEISFERVIKLKNERLLIESYCQSFYYDSFCRLFTMGTNTQMQENELVRIILEMGPPLPKTIENRKQRTEDKSTRHFANQFAFKIRTQRLGNSRDKRNWTNNDDDGNS